MPHMRIELEGDVLFARELEVVIDLLHACAVLTDGVVLACDKEYRQALVDLLKPILAGDSVQHSEEIFVSGGGEEEAAVFIGNILLHLIGVGGEPVKGSGGVLDLFIVGAECELVDKFALVTAALCLGNGAGNGDSDGGGGIPAARAADNRALYALVAAVTANILSGDERTHAVTEEDKRQTGGTTLCRITKEMHFESKGRNKDLVIYDCTSGYPVPFEDICLLELTRLRELYADRIKAIGFSGHHLGIAVDSAAVALGAEWIERHYTLDRTWKGTDHAASLEPDGVRKLVRDCKAVAKSLTYKKEEILDIEKIQRDKLKKHQVKW